MRFSRFALAALALPLLAGCSSLVDNQKMGPLGTPSGGAMFANYIALGTSISAGVQSGGISDSTQSRAYPSCWPRRWASRPTRTGSIRASRNPAAPRRTPIR